MPVTYRSSGVDIDKADGWLSRMQPLIRSTSRAGVLPDRGQFAGLFRLAAMRLRDPILVASTDGVGTKLRLAQQTGEHEGIGVDAVAMNTNDVLVYGATPLFFLDYLAVGSIQPALMSGLLRGIVRGCRLSGCTLLGGETAEMPGSYGPGEYDVAGFCVGAVERSRLLDGSAVRAGDAIVGLASSGVHANGFSLVRSALSRAQLRRFARELLTPTRIYVKPVLQALSRMPIAAIAHVTGGGIARRIPSLVARAPGLRATLFERSWPVPKMFTIIQEAGRVSTPEMRSTFNMGIGMALVCRAGSAARLIRIMQRAGVPAWTIGTIERTRS
ncbi:MAG: phosphoribosylformylglycinamidine cyclo-ligase [Candidatus Omnitrophica bacterium]|nr:phosphoribosylformylglycinamidine cyclo-ligase [Candidatus Omnitrophota bacterium]